MQHRGKSQAGFTLIEFLVFVLALSALVTIALINIRNVRAHHRDKASKVEINTIDYYLESYHEKNGFYPQAADTTTLIGIDPEVLKDKNGRPVNTVASAYKYMPHDCVDGKCKSFELEVELEKEALFVKTSLSG